jgi:hypothetical protein
VYVVCMGFERNNAVVVNTAWPIFDQICFIDIVVPLSSPR